MKELLQVMNLSDSEGVNDNVGVSNGGKAGKLFRRTVRSGPPEERVVCSDLVVWWDRRSAT